MNSFKYLLLIFVLLNLNSEPTYAKNTIDDIANKNTFISFQLFMKEYGKKYNSIQELVKRFEIFKNNIEGFKKLKESSSALYGITKFSDLTKEEFKKYLGLNIKTSPTKFYEKQLISDIPESFDWREKGAVSKVKNQFICGSCWAFSVVGNIEGVNYLKTKKMQLLSEQQLVSCDKVDQGCEGGYMEDAYKYLLKAGGIESDDYYYVGFDDECQFDKDKIVVTISNYVFDKTGDYNQIKSMLMNNAPLSIGLNAYYLQSYKLGIIDLVVGEECTNVIDHGVLLVGFGKENGKEYWIIKNSWGADWGESGFFRIANEKGICGVNSYVSTALMN